MELIIRLYFMLVTDILKRNMWYFFLSIAVTAMAVALIAHLFGGSLWLAFLYTCIGGLTLGALICVLAVAGSLLLL